MQRERTVQTIHGVVTTHTTVDTPILDDIIQWDESPLVSKIIAGDDISAAHDEALKMAAAYDHYEALHLNEQYDDLKYAYPDAKPQLCSWCDRFKHIACALA